MNLFGAVNSEALPPLDLYRQAAFSLVKEVFSEVARRQAVVASPPLRLSLSRRIG